MLFVHGQRDTCSTAEDDDDSAQFFVCFLGALKKRKLVQSSATIIAALNSQGAATEALVFFNDSGSREW